MPMLTREALYDLVWCDPVRTVAERFNLSDNGLKKICAKADVPVPERGYWAKLAADKPVRKTPLPPRGPGMSHDISFGPPKPWRWPPDPEADLAEPLPVEPVFEEPIETVEERVRKAVGKVPVLRNFTHTHHEVRKLLTKDEQRREKMRLSRYPSSWDSPYFDDPFEQRRLKVLNSLFVGLDRSGCRPWLRGHQARELGVTVGCQHVSFALDHPSAKPSRHGEAVIHGGKVDTLRLAVVNAESAANALVWVDTEERSLEDQMTEMVVGILMAGERQYRHFSFDRYRGDLRHREEMVALLAKRKAEAEEAERKRRAEEARKQRETLIGMARDWRTAADLRAFIATALGQVDASEDGIAAWAAWASNVADRIDPLKQSGFATTLPTTWAAEQRELGHGE